MIGGDAFSRRPTSRALRFPAIRQRPCYPPALGHSSHTGSYETHPARVRSFYVCDKNVIKDVAKRRLREKSYMSSMDDADLLTFTNFM
jgi:hypothetical protein